MRIVFVQDATPLALAAHKNHVSLTELLLLRGPNPAPVVLKVCLSKHTVMQQQLKTGCYMWLCCTQQSMCTYCSEEGTYTAGTSRPFFQCINKSFNVIDCLTRHLHASTSCGAWLKQLAMLVLMCCLVDFLCTGLDMLPACVRPWPCLQNLVKDDCSFSHPLHNPISKLQVSPRLQYESQPDGTGPSCLGRHQSTHDLDSLPTLHSLSAGRLIHFAASCM